jgi:hypothetical protein
MVFVFRYVSGRASFPSGVNRLRPLPMPIIGRKEPMIKLPSCAATLPLLLLATACGGYGDGESGEAAAALVAPRTIELQPVAGSGVRATLTITPPDSGSADTAAAPAGRLETALSAQGLDPQFVYPVHLRSGSCGSDKGVVAQLVSLTPDEDGRATSSTSLEAASVAEARSLFAQISGPGGEPVACGDL